MTPDHLRTMSWRHLNCLINGLFGMLDGDGMPRSNWARMAANELAGDQPEGGGWTPPKSAPKGTAQQQERALLGALGL